MANEKKAIICSVGDLMLCDSPLYVSVGAGSRYPELREKLFRDCGSVFKSADLTIANLEGAVYEPRNKSMDEQQMACREEAIRDLKDQGLDILNLANNHCLQHGVDSFLRTAEICRENGIHAGGIRNEEPYFVTVGGIRMAFLFICIHYEWYEPDDIRYEDDIDRIFAEVRKIRQEDPGTLVILSVHWGDEFATYPSNAQITLGHRFVEQGVDIILGHHSHVFQGIEEYEKGLIVYGQGNFISDMVPELCRQTGIVRITVTQEENAHSIHYEVLPCYANNDFVPELREGTWFPERQKELQAALNGEISDDVYWQRRTQNHRICHNAFREYFTGHVKNYKLRVSFKMIMDFAKRKWDKITGKSSFGRKGSMDENMYAAAERAGNIK